MNGGAREISSSLPERVAGAVPRPAVAAFALLLVLLLPALPAVQAQGQVSFSVAVLSARNLGCSSDDDRGADLRIQVRLNGDLILFTPEATDQEAPVYGVRADATTVLPARISVLVQEAEGPTPAFPGGSVYTCDVAQGEDLWFNGTYSGGAAERIVARGDGPLAAEVVLVVGTGAPASPQAAVLGVTASSATLQWTRAQGAAAVAGLRVARGAVGENLSILPVDTTSATLTGLCDNHAYAVRVVRDTPPWTLSSADATFTTSNVPPLAARVLRAETAGANLTVAWESRTLHDVGRYEVHVGPDAGFAPTADTMRGTLAGSKTEARSGLTVPHRAGDGFVRIRTVDSVGLSAISEAFAVGGPAAAPTSPAPTDACTAITVEAPGATQPPPPPPPPPPPAPPHPPDADRACHAGRLALPRDDDARGLHARNGHADRRHARRDAPRRAGWRRPLAGPFPPVGRRPRPPRPRGPGRRRPPRGAQEKVSEKGGTGEQDGQGRNPRSAPSFAVQPGFLEPASGIDRIRHEQLVDRPLSREGLGTVDVHETRRHVL
jgi:hypothetical protein